MKHRKPTFRMRIALVLLALPLMAQKCPTAPKAEDACTLGWNGEPPVIIVAGTFSPGIANELFLGNALHLDGYTHCVFELNGDDSFANLPGTAPIPTSAAGLKIFVDRVLEWSGDTQVNLIGHSQGVLAARDFINNRGGDDGRVGKLISLAGPNQGTESAALVELFLDNVLDPFGSGCDDVVPCEQMQLNSTYIENLGDPIDTPGPIDYYSFYTEDDLLVWKWKSGPLGIPLVSHGNAKFKDGGTNVKVQDECLGRYVSHLGMILDPVVYEMVSDALSDRSINVSLAKCLLPVVPSPI